jgi:hypothetical protein
MGAVPEFDPCFWENVGDRHHGGPDDTKGMLDAVTLERFYECFFGRHFHSGDP